MYMPKNGYTLSFSRKNQDVKEMLEEQQKNGAIISDFVCEAVRFYIKNKDKINNHYSSNNNFNTLDINDLKQEISEQIKKEIKDIINKEKSQNYNLENIKNLSVMDLEED